MPPVTRAPRVILTRLRERIFPLLRNFSYRAARSPPFLWPSMLSSFQLNKERRRQSLEEKGKHEPSRNPPANFSLLSRGCKPTLLPLSTDHRKQKLAQASSKVRTRPPVPWAAWLTLLSAQEPFLGHIQSPEELSPAGCSAPEPTITSVSSVLVPAVLHWNVEGRAL